MDFDFSDSFNTQGVSPIEETDAIEGRWLLLMEEIIKGNVVPVIGSDVLTDGNISISQQFINSVARQCDISEQVDSFSELVYNENFLKKVGKQRDTIYVSLNRAFQDKVYPASESLRKFLSIRQFPFVLTTSFIPIVEQVMHDTWGDELKVMKFSNNPKKNDDIIDGSDMRKPTVYYMFGRAGDGPHRYVVTDTDMLDFCSSWLSGEEGVRPQNLVNELRGKFLLMLGNGYSDWLMRFIWYSMRLSDKMGNGLLVDDKADEKLIKFMMRTEVFSRKDPRFVMDEIVKRLDSQMEKNERTKFDNVDMDADVFISYSRSDSEVASKLCSELTKLGKRVWYDKNNLGYGQGGVKFEDEIMKGIRKAKYFVPILTKNIENEKNDIHVYRKEWNEAINVSVSLGRVYLIPIFEKGFDFYKAAIPTELQRHNALEYCWDGNDDEIKRIAAEIVHTMNK